MTLWGVYLLECADGTLYCGVTLDMEQRLTAHNEGKGAKYTRSRLPVSLVAFSGCLFDHGEALRQERAVKRLPARQKEAHIRALADKPDGGTP